MDITHCKDSHRFESDLGPDGVAYLAYEPLDAKTLNLQHTVVPDAAQGSGVGSSLVEAAFTHARENDLRVIPSCPFVADWLDGHPEHLDLVVSAGE